MSEWKTPKGTVLYLIDLKGKPYLPVAERLIWFREEHAFWSIETTLVDIAVDSCLAKTVIRDEIGRQIASAHKFENRQGFQDFIEKSETGSLGRALAMCGYGTQFCADELDEGERIVDAPRNTPAVKVEVAPEPQAKKLPFRIPANLETKESPAEFCMPFGRDKGKPLSELGIDGVMKALQWFQTKATPNYRISATGAAFEKNAKAYLEGIRGAPPAAPMPDANDLVPSFDDSEDIPF